jgi:SAM-dependent methyltransferase
MTDFRAANRANWNERVPIHRNDRFGCYRIGRLLAGEDRLHPIEDAELGPIAGKRLVHLQCHFGLDTLRLARRGAAVTGLDFSPVAIAEARRLAQAIGRPEANFVCADVYEARRVLDGTFDVVFNTWGTICWLPDMGGWAETVASLLAPGGFLYFADGHPCALVLEERDGRLVPWFSVDTPAGEPLVFDEPVTYTGDPTRLTAMRTYEWIHSLSRVLNALLAAGLRLEFLNEHDAVPWRMFPMCVAGDDGLYRLPEAMPRIPLAFSLKARK